MESNYYNYSYGNSSYPQNHQQSFPDQYSSTAPAAAAAQASQTYNPASQSQLRQTSSAVQQSVATDSRLNTAQYNGLHFPVPAPARQTVAPTSHDLDQLTGSTVDTVSNSSGGARFNAPTMGNATGYGSTGHYQPSNEQSVSQPRQQADAITGLAHGRAEHALSASTGWNAGTGATTSSTGQATSTAATADYGYSCSKPNTTASQQQQQSYYGTQRTSTTPSTTTQTTPYSNSAPRSSSAASKQSSQRQLNQGYAQPAQTSSKASHSYEISSVKTNPLNTAPAYQQTAEYGKAYHDGTDQSQYYLHRVYTLPTRNATDNSNSCFSNTHATETFYTPSSQTSKQSTMTQTASYSKPAQDLGRISSVTAASASSYNYDSSASVPAQPNQQQYYQDYAFANVTQHQATSYSDITASTASTAPATLAPAPTLIFASQPAVTPTPAAKMSRKPCQSVSQKSPTKTTPKSRTPSTKSGVSQSTAINVDLPEQSLPPDLDMHMMEQHMREMVEKMREYQSKNPTAFQQVWENVKRGNSTAGARKGAAPISSTGSKSTPGVGTPEQTVANLTRPPAARQSTPAETGKQTPTLKNAAPQVQKTGWPSTQKVALSQTVSTFLTSLGQSCSESYAMDLLDYGPTFAELCQKLEGRGYRFERNKLALELLKTSESVDSSKAASTSAPAISAAKPSSDVPPRTMTSQSMKSFNPRNVKDSITNLIPQVHHHDHSQNFVAPSTPAPVPIPSTHTIVGKPAQEPGKRRVSPAKKSQQPSSSNAPQTPQAVQTAPPGPESKAPAVSQPRFPPTLREEPMPDASPLTITITKPISRYENLIQATSPNPFDRFQAGEDNSALGKLQSKLEAQMSRLKKLDEPTPVSAPTQPAPLPAPLPPAPSRKPAWPRAPSWNKKDALRRSTYDPRTIVQDVLQATGRHPQYEGLNSGLAILKRLHPDVFDNNTDLAAIPWDIYDPPPAPLPREERKPKKSVVPDEEETRGRKREPVPFKDVPRAEPIPSISTLARKRRVGGKRGRPRGSRGTPRAVRRGRGGATAGGPLETPNTATNSAGDQSTKANAHRYGTVIRVNINTLRNGGSASSSGRKRKYSDSPDPRYPSDGNGGTWGNSSFQTLPVFKCQWEKCNQELQNLGALRKHLIKKHKAENTQGVLPCCWGNCGTLIPVGMLDPQTGKQIFVQKRRGLNFGTAMAWDNHVLGEHLKVVRDELGDGMSVSAARSLSRDSSAHSVEGRLRSMSRDQADRSHTPVITQAPHGYKFAPPPSFSGGTQFKLAHEFPEEIDIKTDADEQNFLEDELARIERMGAGTESFSIPDIPGLEFDNGEGWITKIRKLTIDLSKVPPLPTHGWTESGDGNEEKGKGRADD